MSRTHFKSSILAVVLHLFGAHSAELCYVDATSGVGVYCDPNCCGDPVYCCDKESFIVENALFGTLGLLMIVGVIACCIWKKRKSRKKKARMEKANPLRKQAKNIVAPMPPSAAAVVVVPEPGDPQAGGSSGTPKPSSQHQDSHPPPAPPAASHPSQPPPPYGQLVSSSQSPHPFSPRS